MRQRHGEHEQIHGFHAAAVIENGGLNLYPKTQPLGMLKQGRYCVDHTERNARQIPPNETPVGTEAPTETLTGSVSKTLRQMSTAVFFGGGIMGEFFPYTFSRMSIH